MRNTLLAVAMACLLPCACAQVHEGEILRYEIEGQEYTFADFAEYGLYVPSSGKPIRAVMILQHGCTMEQFGITKPYDLQYQAFANKWNIAVLETALHGDCHIWGQPEDGSAAALMDILARAGTDTGHPEIQDAPWLLWGHSGGGYWVLAMLRDYPERIVAAVSYSAAFDPGWSYGSPAAQVPLLLRHAGPEDAAFANCYGTANHTFARLRSINAPVSIAYNHGQNHNLSNLRHMMIPFFEAAMAQRLPGKPSDPLKALDYRKSFLADTLTHSLYREETFKGDKSSMCRFPDQTSAMKWKEFVETNDVADTTAPPQPSSLTASQSSDGTVLLQWKADADVESGIGHFNVYIDGKKAGSLPQEGEYQSFNRNGDNTEPVDPCAMEFSLTSLDRGRHVLGVENVNQFGLASEMRTVTIRVQ